MFTSTFLFLINHTPCIYIIKQVIISITMYLVFWWCQWRPLNRGLFLLRHSLGANTNNMWTYLCILVPLSMEDDKFGTCMVRHTHITIVHIKGTLHRKIKLWSNESIPVVNITRRILHPKSAPNIC